MKGFRNLADADLEIPAEGFVLVGKNGHGKTSLVEAMLYCEVFRSFRGAGDRELVKFGADGFFVETGLQENGAPEAGRRPDAQRWAGNGEERARLVAAGFDARTREKKVTVGRVEAEKLADAIGIVRGVVLSPGDVALVAGGPRERRRYLDVMLSLTVKGYVEALGRYRRALRHRCHATAADMPAWERVLAETGSRVIEARRGWTERWAERYAALCGDMGEERASGPAGQRAGPALEYVPSARGDLLEALEKTRERDLARGRTSVGPHRDDLKLALGGHDLRTYGSAGQHRTAALALRICEAETLEAPTICLDDAFAELDVERSRRLGAMIEAMAAAGKQVIAAVPKAGEVPRVISGLPVRRIEHGEIRA